MPASQLRIAMVSIHSCPVGNLGSKDTGGMSVYIRELAYELGKQGHLVDVYTRIHDPEDHQIYRFGQNARLVHLKAGEDEEIHKLAVYSHLPDFIYNLESFVKLDALHYDLIFSHYWLSGLVGEYLQRQWDIPHITMYHTLGAVKNTLGVGEYEPELRLEAEKGLAQNCQRIIAPTENEKELLIRHYGALPQRIGVVPCGVNFERFKPVNKESARQHLGFTADDKIFLFVGRIDPLKGISKLIKAVSYLQDIQRLKLVIIGGGEHSRPEIKQLQKLSCTLNIPDSVIFPGLVKHEQLPYFYSAADACVIPSYYESFGMVALESLACGTPVIATNVGNLKSVIRQGETGYVIPDNAPRHLADKIALLLSSSGIKTESALSIRASVSKFSWLTITETIIKECQQVIAGYAASVS